MVNERAPPKVPLNSINPNGENTSRELSPDDDITALVRGMSSLKGKVRGDMSDPFNPADATNTPTFGHPTKMMSSRKQRADPFIRQKTRPEHHLDSRSSNSNNGARITGPRGPVYQDRRPPPMPMFSSNAPSAPPVASSYAPARHYGEETFYTDPAKASADLKALLEGGMEEGEEEGGEQSQADRPKTSEDPKDAKDGTVDGLKVKLLPHQVEGVEWMRGRELGPVKRGKVPKGGILADDMGLGKTLQTISLILTNQKPAKDAPGWKKHFEKIEKTTLVVAPLALIRQWEHEINDKVEKTHGLKVCVHHGPNRTKRFKELALYDVVITTYQILVSEHGNSSDAENGLKAGCFGLHWWRVVLDEAHTVKNRNAKATKACYALNSEYRWCLSGTPMQNNLDELQSLVKFLRIRPYDDLKEWKEHIDLPLKNGRGHIAIRRLHSLLRCFMKRRTKEILKEAGALNPGGKPSAEGEGSSTGFKVTERKVVTISTALSPAERKFYDRLAARADRSIEQMMQGKVNYANALTLLLRLRQACNHPKLVEGKLEKDKDAMSTDATQKTQDTDIDAMADMFAGMGIVSRDCNICGRGLSHEDNKSGKDICSDCYDDLAYFNNHERPERSERSEKPKKPKDKSRKKDKKKEIVDEKVIDRQIVEVDDDEDDDDD
ncbi:RIS1-similarity to RAD5 protein [Fusarium fujikuroi]|nr:RIS1-similarity to RAD5 protein [Fusarium fujikuroi]